MSLWPVHDAATKELMVRFHEELKHLIGDGSAGMKYLVSIALREAVQRFRTEEFNAVYYLAGFVISGAP